MEQVPDAPMPPTEPSDTSSEAISEANQSIQQVESEATAVVASAAQPPAVPPPTAPVVPEHRPTGITILAVLAILSGFLQLLFALPLMGLNLMQSAGVVSSVTGGFVALVLGVIWLAAGIGLLQLKPWAWMLGVIAVGLSVLGAIWSMFTSGFCVGFMSLILPAIVLWYLTRPHVKAAFGRA
jgi:hypothetical protein